MRSSGEFSPMRPWWILRHLRSRVSRMSFSSCARMSVLGEALAYIAKHRDRLGRFRTDGHVEIDNNTVKRTICLIALIIQTASSRSALVSQPCRPMPNTPPERHAAQRRFGGFLASLGFVYPQRHVF